MKTFEEFRKDLKEAESSNNYKSNPGSGFYGAYQFGKPRLYDLGISLDGWHPFGREVRKFVLLDDFLNNKELQDELFDIHVYNYAARIRTNFQNYIGQTINNIKITLSGCVAVAHNQGFGSQNDPGLKQFLEQHIDDEDGLGTKMSDYMKKFEGYDLYKKKV